MCFSTEAGPKAESALRIFGADGKLLLVEGIAIAKLIMLAIVTDYSL